MCSVQVVYNSIMSKQRLSISALIIVAAGILFLAVLKIQEVKRFYDGVFRLSEDQVRAALQDIPTTCNQIMKCSLIPGDILIRRYITSRTKTMDMFGHVYFTHAAFYIGSDQIVEAIGTEKDPQDEVQITSLSKSDWANTDVTDFVIIRPKKYQGKLDSIIGDFKDIAADPEYRFGFPGDGPKRTTCADIIFKQLVDKGVVNMPDAPNIITPDYLFWMAKNDTEKFEIVGYGSKSAQ